MASEAQEIVVTGMGVVTPAGCSLDTFWTALVAGQSTASTLDGPEFAPLPVRLGCQVSGLDTVDALPAKRLRRLDPFARFGLAAAVAAHQDAGAPTPPPERAAVLVGNAVGGRATSDRETRNYVERGAAAVNPLMPLMTMPNAAAATIAMQLGWRGPAYCLATTCASGADAIGQAMALLRTGRMDVVVAGGCESTLSPVTLAAFANLNALSVRNEDPARASRPFDSARDGFVMGEGAGFVVLERARDARARGVRGRAVLAGYAATTDAHHLSMPAPDGIGAIAAIRGALADASLTPGDIAHVNAHGTSTPLNDRIEAAALREVFGDRVPPVTAAKGVTGHLIGAAGAVELIATVLAVEYGLVPPTANHQETEPGMEIDVVHGRPRQLAPGPALSESFGFGGHNACLVVVPR
ncbi:beta-ketoacyl-[acyl-carrier-protein] synthase family protein [Natronosporangium hydrolyticum]|uniref:Beta-ketoacyl-[acyl-carrier-protein] synthase family protein n=1 Tax=Natronosporangium hydrolyticum TaxID=2811111 RepID=A0A895YNA1_9ACTN|nr:beta-ketoacyl-[acyl-carrier-protein] synthase family protein [Natronosporangium hydrolyticum]QSB16783.1 beta-ketoacyl-[acyl-carrier-protein] synthase family protein [Natronosporangium hydrolyticum]